MRISRLGLPVVLLGFALHQTAQAQEKPSNTLLTVQHYLDFEQVAGPQLAPGPPEFTVYGVRRPPRPSAIPPAVRQHLSTTPLSRSP